MKSLLPFLKKKKKWVIIALLILFTPFLLNVTGIYVSGTWRYEMTVIVETPEGLKEGSAVREVSNSASNIKLFDLPDTGNPAEFRGESVIIDLGERGLMFAVLGIDPYREFYYGFGKYSGASTVKGIRFFNNIPIGKEFVLAPQFYPKMVKFENINDPKSVTLAYETGNGFGKREENNIEKLFGADVRIKEIRMKKVQDQITNNVNQYLPWMKNLRKNGARLNANTSIAISTNELSDNLGPGSFSRGEYR